jgi:exodeoxyribonuclease V beta subunit
VSSTEFSLFDDLSAGIAVIEASAGTGKTYSIASLIVRLIAENEIRADQLLVVTFTRAATAELRDRIRARLFEAASALHDGQSTDEFLTALIARGRQTGSTARWISRIEAARATLDAATIATIHSFCHRVLQWFALEAGREPGGEPILDTSPVIARIVNDMQVELAADPADPFNPVALGIGGLSTELLHKVADAAMSDLRAAVLPDELTPLDAAGLRAAFKDAWSTYAAAAREFGPPVLHGDGPATLLRSLNKKGKVAVAALEGTHVEGFAGILSALTADVPTAVAIAAAETLRHTELSSEVSKRVKPPYVLNGLFAAGDILQATLGGALSRYLTWVVGETRTRFAKHLAQAGETDHSSMLVAVADAITDPERGALLSARLRDRFKAVLIDEFQDTDAMQWEIFGTAFDRDTIVRLIGDPKQAIYRFRGADIRVYAAAAARAQRRGTMTRNFRSDLNILHALNTLLDRPGVFESDDISYVPVDAPERAIAERMRTAAGVGASRVELRVYDGRLAEKDAAFIPSKSALGGGRERLVANDIAALLSSGSEILDEKAVRWRGVVPSDIAVLVDSNLQADTVRKELQKLRIPAVNRATLPVFTTIEAREVLRLLRAMVRPRSRRDLKLVAAGMVFGWTADQVTSDDDASWSGLSDALRLAHDRWQRSGILAAALELFRSHGVETRILRRPGGERSLTNMHHILELLHRAAHDERLGPDALVAWLFERIRRSAQKPRTSPDDPAAQRLETDEAAVQILTVHVSKGLEFGIVYVPFASDLPRGTHDNLIGALVRATRASMERGIWLDLNDPSATAGEYREIEDTEGRQEALRKLYVAVTRARHRLVVYCGLQTDSSRLQTVPASLLWALVGDENRGADWPTLARESLTTDSLEQYLRDVATAHPQTIVVTRIDDAWNSQPSPRLAATTGQLDARRMTRRDLRRGWGLLSFSTMARALKTHARSGVQSMQPGIEGAQSAARDRDDLEVSDTFDAATALESAATPEVSPTPGFDALRAGRTTGDLIHAVFENIDFAEAAEGGCPQSWIGQVAEQAARRGVRVASADAAQVARELGVICRARIETPCAAFALADVAKARRLNELEFSLPLAPGGLSGGARALTEAFIDRSDDERIGRWLERIHAMPLAVVEGMMTGFVDLVFAVPGHGGRPTYLVVDYKTNRLSRSSDPTQRSHDYRPAALVESMVEHHYILQYHLYLVALHRMLRSRLGARYDYDLDVGGAAYLFVRGMALDGAPTGTGVLVDRPPRATIERLDRLIAGRRT